AREQLPEGRCRWIGLTRHLVLVVGLERDPRRAARGDDVVFRVSRGGIPCALGNELRIGSGNRLLCMGGRRGAVTENECNCGGGETAADSHVSHDSPQCCREWGQSMSGDYPPPASSWRRIKLRSYASTEDSGRLLSISTPPCNPVASSAWGTRGMSLILR